MADLDTAVAFEHEVLRRSSTSTWGFPWGFAAVNATYPESHSHTAAFGRNQRASRECRRVSGLGAAEVCGFAPAWSR
jgi:hypothetical protein